MKAWELILRNGWCQGTGARDCDGQSVPYYGPSAVCFCAAGAMMRVYGCFGKYMELYELLTKSLSCIVSVWNDDPATTKEQVIAKLKELDI
jgi:hypothetical protein